jgi:hypothetical protein
MIILGALIEIAQHQLNWGREAEWLDLVADASGVLAMSWMWEWKNYFQKAS